MKRNAKLENGITEGVIWKQILMFFFPIFFGTFFQQLYNTVDSMIVGQLLGKQALAAVAGGTSVITSLFIGFFIGLSSGAGVVISQAFGAKDDESTKKAIHNAAAIGLWGGILISVLGFVTAPMLLIIIGTPEDVINLAVTYVHIYFAGSVFLVIYNIGCSMFQAMGDSRTPLYYLIAGCLSNIGLDFLFVGAFKLGVAGAAYATVISQLISAVCITVSLRHRKDAGKLYYSRIKFDRFLLKKTLVIGLPTGFQSVLYALSNLIIQNSINWFGTDCAAAWAAYSKLDCVFWMMINAFGISMTTFAGQNYGAGRMDRLRKGTNTCIVLAGIFSVAIELLFIIFGRYFFIPFTYDKNVIRIGGIILRNIAPFFVTYVVIEVISGVMRGMGKTIVSTMFTLFGICGFRIIWISVIPRIINTLPSVLQCYPVSWMFTGVMFIFYYRYKALPEMRAFNS